MLAGDPDSKLERYILDVSGKAAPSICYVPTANGDSAEYVNRLLALYASLGVKADVLRFFDRTPANLPEFLSAFDIIEVGGGNTRSMLAVWRHWGLDVLLRQAWERGVVLCGASAGSLCWFDSGLTDSVADSYTAMSCLGFLRGSNCVHYNAPDRRLAYHAMVEKGELGDGVACGDGVAAHYRGDTFATGVSVAPNVPVYFVEKTAGGIKESDLPTMFL